MAILKPAKPVGLANIQIKIPISLAERLQNVRQGAAKAEMVLDLDQPLSKALARLLRAAEAELNQLPNTTSGSLQGKPAGITAVDNLSATAAPLHPLGSKETWNV